MAYEKRIQQRDFEDNEDMTMKMVMLTTMVNSHGGDRKVNVN